MANAITIEELQTQLQQRRIFWEPYRRRADYWHLMMLLIDMVQLTKLRGVKRFIGAEPHSTVMTARAILARNQLQPFIPLFNYDSDEEREGSQAVEKLIIGAFNDIDRVLYGRGMQSSRSIAALHLLVRGWAVSHLLLRNEYKKKGMLTPIDYEPWDMRFFLPVFDKRGYIHSCAYESFPTWADVLNDFPELEKDMAVKGWKINLARSVVRIDWYDETNHAVAIQQSPMPNVTSQFIIPQRLTRSMEALVWAKKPTPHGLETIPVVCMAANGLPFNNLPSVGLGYPPILAGQYQGNVVTPTPVWLSPNGAVAHWGRSILATVEDLVPEYNETVSLLLQIMHNDAFGTWFTQTATGDLTEIDIGGINPLRVGEAIGRVAGLTASPDTYRMLAIIRESYQRGTFSDVLQGLGQFEGSGFLQTQLKNSALNALDQFLTPYKQWATSTAQLLISQLRQAKKVKWDTWGVGNDTRHFRIEVTSKMVQKLWPIEMKPMPALPDDLALRVDIAKRMLDPNMPLASYQTVLDRVLEFGDAQRERELMFEDMAERDPVVVFLRIRNRLLARGMDELAETFGNRAFAMMFIEEVGRVMQLDQASQAMKIRGSIAGSGMQGGGIQGGGRPVQNEGAGFTPSNLPPEASTAPTETPSGATNPVI